MPHLLRHPAFLKNQTPQHVRGGIKKSEVTSTPRSRGVKFALREFAGVA